MNIWITQGKDFEGTEGNQLYRGWIASRAARYREAIWQNKEETPNRHVQDIMEQEKKRIVQEIREEMNRRDAHLFKKKKGDWVEIEGQALDSAIKDSLRSATKKKRKTTNDGPVVHSSLPASPLSSAQLTPVYAQRFIPLLTATATDSPATTHTLNTLLSSGDYEPLDYKSNNDTSQTLPSPEPINSVRQQPPTDLFIPSLPTGPADCSHGNRDLACLPLSSRQQHRDSYLSLLEDSMFHLACSKIHEKELNQ